MITVTCVGREGIKATYKCNDEVVHVWQHRVGTDNPAQPTVLWTKVEHYGKEYIYEGSSYVAAALWAFGVPDAFVQHNV